MKLGVDSYAMRNSGLEAVEVLSLAARLGLSGVLFELSPFSSFRDAYLTKVRATAEQKGLYLEFGMGSILQWHPTAEKGRLLLADASRERGISEAQVIIRHLQVASRLGSPILRIVAGDWHTRDQGHDMVAMADQVVAILREACRAAENFGIKIALQNHADFTARELVSIYARVDSPAFGFAVDTADLAFDLDHPGRLAEILAPYALTAQLKNYRVLPSGEGLALENCAVGDGDIDLPAIVQTLAKHNPQIHLNLEVHTQLAPFRLDLLQPAYWTRHPAPPGDGLAWYLEKAWGRPRPESWPARLADGPEAWQREADDIRASVRWAKRVLAAHLTA